jgi:hypothetical protein
LLESYAIMIVRKIEGISIVFDDFYLQRMTLLQNQQNKNLSNDFEQTENDNLNKTRDTGKLRWFIWKYK